MLGCVLLMTKNQYATTEGRICEIVDVRCLNCAFEVAFATCVLFSNVLSGQKLVTCVIPWPYCDPYDAALIILLIAWAVPASRYALSIFYDFVRWLGRNEKLSRIFAPSIAQVVRDDCVFWLERSGVVYKMHKWCAEAENITNTCGTFLEACTIKCCGSILAFRHLATYPNEFRCHGWIFVDKRLTHYFVNGVRGRRTRRLSVTMTWAGWWICFFLSVLSRYLCYLAADILRCMNLYVGRILAGLQLRSN